MSFRLTVVVDNFALRGKLRAEHGFSLLLEAGKERLLVDTGMSALTVTNLRALEVEPQSIGSVVITHGHYDHAGGLMPLIEAGAKPQLYISPEAFERKFAKRKSDWKNVGLQWSADDVVKAGARIVTSERPTELVPGVWLTGSISEVEPFPAGKKNLYAETSAGDRAPDTFDDERAVVLDGDDGIVVISGCGHRGIVNALLAARELLPGRPVAAVLGGMHMGAADDAEVETVAAFLAAQRVRLLGVAHCTGLNAWATLRRIFGSSAAWLGTGTRMQFL